MSQTYLAQEGRMHLLDVRMQLIQRIEIGFRAVDAIQNGTVAAIADRPLRIVRVIRVLVMLDIDVRRIFPFVQTADA